MNKFRYLFSSLLIVFVFLIFVEIFSHFILTRIYNRDFDSSLIVDNKYFNSSGLKENANGIVWGKAFHTNEFGCRKNLKPYNPRKKKWLFIGDSVTEGIGVNDSSTFSSLVADKIDSFNILNYSLIGYSVSDYLNVLRSILSSNDSTINRATIFFCLNDVYGNTQAKDLPVMGKQNLIGKLNFFLQNHYATYKLLKLYLFRNADRYFQYDSQFYKEDEPRFIEAMTYLHQCGSVCRGKNIYMDVVMLPYRSQVSGNDSTKETPQALVHDYCLRNQISFSDVTVSLSKEADTRSLYLFSDEIHFSEKGHKAIADFILSH